MTDRNTLCMAVGVGVNWMGPRPGPGVCVHREVGGLRLVALMPLMTLKVVADIHWEALKIWLRGGKFHRKPEPPSVGVS